MSAILLHLLRHGAPDGAGRLIGHGDARPTPEGIAACVDRVRGLAVEMLLSSDLSRARLVGEAIGRATGQPLATDARWRELDFGAWDGLLPAAIDSAALARFWDDPDGHPPPGGESWSALTHRVSAAIDMLAKPTLIVTHAGAMRAAVAHLCGFSARQAWAIDLPYASLLSLRIWREPGARPTAQIIGLCA